MMASFAMLWLVLAGVVSSLVPLTLRVIDDQGLPVTGAQVTFVDAAGEADHEQTGGDGRVQARAGFTPIFARITQPGFVPLRVNLPAGDGTTVTLVHAITVIGTVRIATGSQHSLHELPVAASVLDRAAIAQAPATTTDGLLASLPGVDRSRSNSAFTNYGQLRVSFDGAGNDRGLVLVDGIPAQDAFGGQVDWAAYPAQSIVRAELLRGAGSALYGSGAIGGALDLQTLGPATQSHAPAGALISLGTGGYGGQDAALFAQSSVGSRLNASLWSSTTKLAYYDFPASYYSPVSGTAHSQSDATQLRLRYALGRGTLAASTLLSTDAQNEGRPNYSFGRSLEQYALSYAQAGAHTSVSLSAYQRDTSVLNINDSYPVHPGVLQYVQTVPAWENGVSVSFIQHTSATEFEVRADHRAVHGFSNQVGPDDVFQILGAGSQALTGVALQESLLTKRFEVLAGARYDTISFTNGKIVTAASPSPLTTLAGDRTDAALSPRAALRLDLSPAAALRLSAGSGFRAPYLNELVRGFSIGKVAYEPNINLLPEHSATQSAGLDLLGTRSRLAVDIFNTGVSDAIEYLTLSPTLMQRGNIEQTKTDGTTFTFTQGLGSCTRLRLGGTSQYARVTAAGAQAAPGSVGKRPEFVPNRSASLGLDVNAQPVTYGIDINYLGQTYADDLNTEPLNSALLFGLRASALAGNGATWSFVWQNITDQHYLTSVDRIGIPAHASIEVRFPIGVRPAQTAPLCS
jgi:outer membrane cobalamin receptor